MPSQTGKGRYTSIVGRRTRHCTCPDYEDGANKCKHIFAVEFTIRREREVTVESDGSGTVDDDRAVTITVTKRVDLQAGLARVQRRPDPREATNSRTARRPLPGRSRSRPGTPRAGVRRSRWPIASFASRSRSTRPSRPAGSRAT